MPIFSSESFIFLAFTFRGQIGMSLWWRSMKIIALYIFCGRRYLKFLLGKKYINRVYHWVRELRKISILYPYFLEFLNSLQGTSVALMIKKQIPALFQKFLAGLVHTCLRQTRWRWTCGSFACTLGLWEAQERHVAL